MFLISSSYGTLFRYQHLPDTMDTYTLTRSPPLTPTPCLHYHHPTTTTIPSPHPTHHNDPRHLHFTPRLWGVWHRSFEVWVGPIGIARGRRVA